MARKPPKPSSAIARPAKPSPAAAKPTARPSKPLEVLAIAKTPEPAPPPAVELPPAAAAPGPESSPEPVKVPPPTAEPSTDQPKAKPKSKGKGKGKGSRPLPIEQLPWPRSGAELLALSQEQIEALCWDARFHTVGLNRYRAQLISSGLNPEDCKLQVLRARLKWLGQVAALLQERRTYLRGRARLEAGQTVPGLDSAIAKAAEEILPKGLMAAVVARAERICALRAAEQKRGRSDVDPASFDALLAAEPPDPLLVAKGSPSPTPSSDA